MDRTCSLLVSALTGGISPVAIVAQLAQVPKEQVWLATQKSSHTRPVYRRDAQHFMQTLGIASIDDELYQADHKSVIAWLNTLAAIAGKGAGFCPLGDTWADTTHRKIT